MQQYQSDLTQEDAHEHSYGEQYDAETVGGSTANALAAPSQSETRGPTKGDIYSIVTERIVEQLKNGVVPWHLPITQRGSAKNLISGKDYRGINPFILNSSPYESRYWVTFRQARNLGGTVRKGERGYPVVYWHWRSEEELKKLSTKTPAPARCFPLYYTVFNLNQCDGIKTPPDDTERFNHSPIEEAERVVREMPRPPSFTTTNKEAAYYIPSRDTICLPPLARFETAESYYSTLFHELGHSTGHESRLNRIASSKNRSFGSEEYSFEELVAEMTAAFLCTHCLIENQVSQSASYIDFWLAIFKKDRRILLDSATSAQRACDFILGKTFNDGDSRAATVMEV